MKVNQNMKEIWQFLFVIYTFLRMDFGKQKTKLELISVIYSTWEKLCELALFKI